MIAWVFVVPVLFWIISGLRVIQEYESGVIFRLGRFAEVKRAGLNWIVPGVDRMVKVDLRTVTRDVPHRSRTNGGSMSGVTTPAATASSKSWHT